MCPALCMRSSSNVAKWTKLYLATMADHVTICGLDRAHRMLQILQLIFNIMNQIRALLHLATILTLNPHLLPFWKTALVPSVSGATSWGIEQPHALPSNPVARNGPSWSLGRKTTLKQTTGPTSACTSTSGMHAPCNLQVATASIPVPSAVTHVMALVSAPETSLSDVLYIHTTPYNPKTWLAALSSSNLISSFPNLVHNLTYGSPIGNPPPLLC